MGDHQDARAHGGHGAHPQTLPLKLQYLTAAVHAQVEMLAGMGNVPYS